MELHNGIHMDVHMGICMCESISIPMSVSMCVTTFVCILWMYNHWILLNTPHVNTNIHFVSFLFHCVICVTLIHIVFHCFYFMLRVHVIVLLVWTKGNKDQSINQSINNTWNKRDPCLRHSYKCPVTHTCVRNRIVISPLKPYPMDILLFIINH